MNVKKILFYLNIVFEHGLKKQSLLSNLTSQFQAQVDRQVCFRSPALEIKEDVFLAVAGCTIARNVSMLVFKKMQLLLSSLFWLL